MGKTALAPPPAIGTASAGHWESMAECMTFALV